VSVRKWLNTSGQSYRALGKAQVDAASDAQLVDWLAADGKLVKRPVLVLKDRVAVGFKPETYARHLGFRVAVFGWLAAAAFLRGAALGAPRRAAPRASWVPPPVALIQPLDQHAERRRVLRAESAVTSRSCPARTPVGWTNGSISAVPFDTGSFTDMERLLSSFM
jgi:hypothetical protein